MRETLKNSLRKNEEEIFDYSEIPSSDTVLNSIKLPSYGVQDRRQRKLKGVLALVALVSVLGLSLLSPDVRAFVGAIAKVKESTATLYIKYADYLRFGSVEAGRVNNISYKNDDHTIVHYFEPLASDQYIYFDDTLKLKFVENEPIRIAIQYYLDKTGCIAKFEYNGMLHTIFSDMPEEDFREMLQSMQLQE